MHIKALPVLGLLLAGWPVGAALAASHGGHGGGGYHSHSPRSNFAAGWSQEVKSAEGTMTPHPVFSVTAPMGGDAGADKPSQSYATTYSQAVADRIGFKGGPLPVMNLPPVWGNALSVGVSAPGLGGLTGGVPGAHGPSLNLNWRLGQ